jgi:hypothetical protein
MMDNPLRHLYVVIIATPFFFFFCATAADLGRQLASWHWQCAREGPKGRRRTERTSFTRRCVRLCLLGITSSNYPVFTASDWRCALAAEEEEEEEEEEGLWREKNLKILASKKNKRYCVTLYKLAQGDCDWGEKERATQLCSIEK